MAEKIIQFNAKKEIFDRAAARLACLDCKVVPKVVPIFQTSQGDVLCSICKTKRSSNSSNYSARSFLCSICKPKSKSTGIFRNFVLEELLMSLPTSCKYQKNECRVVLQDREHLSYHEEDCDFREVLCSYYFCKKRIPANQFKNHFLEKHKTDLEKSSVDVAEIAENGLFKVKDLMSMEYFDTTLQKREDWQGCMRIFYNSKTFLIQTQITNAGYLLIWLQLVGSQFEARNFEYSLKVENPDIGKFSYEGTVRSLDDDKENIFENSLGLAITHGALKKLVRDDYYYFDVKIKDLKAEINKDEDSQIPMSDKEDN